MGRVSRDARLTYILLWTLADDSGRLRGSLAYLSGQIFPYDDDAKKHIGKWIDELEREKCIVRYTVNGDTFIEICKWLQHQKIDKPSKSKLPSREESENIRRGFGEDSPLDQDQDQDQDQGPGSGKGTKGPRTKDQGTLLSADASVSDFDRWWKVYPRRESKAPAKKSFETAVKGISLSRSIPRGEAVEWLLEVTQVFAESPKGKSGKYCPMPATWLNQSRYDDEQSAWFSTNGNSDPRGNISAVNDYLAGLE